MRMFITGWLLVVSAATWSCQGALAEKPEPVRAEYERVDLWPGTDKHTPESGDRPQLLIGSKLQEEPTAAIVVLPGGGYGNLAIDHEGHQIAAWMQSLGIRAAICTYRHRGKGNDGKGYGHPVPMQDAQRAIQYLRANADRLAIDPNRIGIIGFSAGGHLASTVSTHFAVADSTSDDPIVQASSRPDFSILCYPVIAFNKAYTHKGSQKNLLGENASEELIESLSNEKQVSNQTPPTFLFHTAEDTAVPPQNSLVYAMACAEHSVPVELHLFPQGRHGIGLGKDIPGASQWPNLCADWLTRLGMRSE
jgi:acetyl esterase/lipase